MNTLSRLTLPARRQNLRRFVDGVTDAAGKMGYTPEKVTVIQLAAEEALVNVIKYAYPDGDAGDLRLLCAADGDGRFVIEIGDDGVPFDPLAGSGDELPSRIVNRQEGGVGIFLIRKLMDDVQYQRKEGRNVFMLIVDPPSVANPPVTAPM
jgi:anti-sigma regulatory factor (Ser/Thr protein kinase)